MFLGVVWIGLLYYFNFVQIPTMPKVPAELKPGISKHIAPAALFYFRWGAALTVLTAYPALSWLIANPSFGHMVMIELWLSFLYGSYNGATLPALTEILPVQVRTTGFSLSITGQLQAAGRVPSGVWTPDEAMPAEEYVAELARRGVVIREVGPVPNGAAGTALAGTAPGRA